MPSDNCCVNWFDERVSQRRSYRVLETELEVQGAAIEDWVELSERTFNFARYARIWFAEGDKDTKRVIFACLGSNHLLHNQEVLITLEKYFKSISDKRDDAEKELEWFEPLKTPIKSGALEEIRKEFPIMSG